ncbi:hypothetical protein Mapa_006913 [Marchantia paleacea]|nr:hypothetical protein Mapa_006913 [Marchantia paleacea]
MSLHKTTHTPCKLGATTSLVRNSYSQRGVSMKSFCVGFPVIVKVKELIHLEVPDVLRFHPLQWTVMNKIGM